ncbi:MAG: hypothetical protein H6809_06680 [Phycisphaeraceae bacterium]|nr:hypothetical protein [Phycisphaeraceae bacterium]
MNLCLAISLLGFAAGLAQAQTATVQVSHNDPNAVVFPGETLEVRVVVSWQGAIQFAGLRGNSLATGSLGSASNVGSAFSPPGALWRHGTPIAGDIISHNIATISGYWTTTPPPPAFMSSGVEYLTYDWIAPQVSAPTLIEFDFVADPIAPNVRLYENFATPGFVEAQTIYVGTSILVVPMPGTMAIIAAFVLARVRRR